VLTVKHAGDLFLLFLHRLLPMSNDNCLPTEVLLRLDVGLTTGLSHGVQIFGTYHLLLGIGVEQVNGSSLLSEQTLHLVQLLSFRRCLLPLGGVPLLEQETPLYETLPFFLNVGPVSLEYILRLA
jgi:hypothetical protein